MTDLEVSTLCSRFFRETGVFTDSFLAGFSQGLVTSIALAKDGHQALRDCGGCLIESNRLVLRISAMGVEGFVEGFI